MRNLLQLRRAELSINSTEVPDLPLTASTWDPRNDGLICTFGPTEAEAFIEVKYIDKRNFIKPGDRADYDIASWEVPCPIPTLKCDKILSLRYFSDTDTVCLVFAGGNIVTLQQPPDGTEYQIEIVGSVDEGITAAAWSPDEEVLAITTAASTFLLMTRSFEVIADNTISVADMQASKHVSVGWGKKETQFKGKRARAMQDPTVPESVDEGVLSPHDDGAVRISWRGDGAYVSISSVEEGKRRLIRVYTREGTLDSVSEPVDGLEGVICWRPSGNLIAGIQRHAEKIDVVFFERNGLRHGEFPLRLAAADVPGERVYQISWNADSTVLAICLRKRVQLWTMGNYHWYLKQEIPYDATESLQYPQDVPTVEWHLEKGLKIAVALKDRVLVYEYLSSVSKGGLNPPHDYGMVAVADGEYLKLTPLRIGNVPPPMALYDISIESTPVDIAICKTDCLVAVLRHTAIDIVRWYPDKPRNARKPVLTPNIFRFTVGDNVRQICFLKHDLLAVLSNRDGCNVIVCIRIDAEGTTVVSEMKESKDNGEDVQITKIFPGFSDDEVLFAMERQHIGRRRLEDNTSSGVEKLPVPCSEIEVTTVGDKVYYFGLADKGKLYANQKLIAPNVTSFVVTGAYLIYTTTQHLLKFVHLHSNNKELEIPSDDPTGDERCRSIERGARIVSVMPSNFSLTLQMPRGNLETIFPRALVLAGVRRNIEVLDYKTAFMACRSQRVDLNILHDHAPEQFLENIPLFIDQLKKIEHIDLFLSQLREEVVTQTMYRETILQAEAPQQPEPANKQLQTPSTPQESKVNRICNAFLKVLLPSRLSTNLQNVITAYCCMSPPDHESALQLIEKLREENLEQAEQAVIHICFLADVNKLYNNALGLYNLELTLMVAQQSQKDPKEYLPFLQALEETELRRRKFNIDDHLGRYSKAVEHLHELGEEVFEELKDYVVKHELYQQALRIYRYNSAKQKVLMRLYATYLDTQSRFSDAGLAYESVSEPRLAVEAYRRASLWQHALSCAADPLAEYTPSELSELALTLAEALVESKDYSAAATIHRDYLHNISEAATLLCKGSHFSEGIRLVTLHTTSQPPSSPTTTASSLLTTIIDPGLIDAFNTVSELLADCKSQSSAQLSRLRELRTKREADPYTYFDTGATNPSDPAHNIPDDISVAATDASTSGRTFLTQYTGKTGGTALTGTSRRTSKNKKREDRKRARGKKGTIYEEEYLVNSLARLVERLESVKGDTGRLVEGLVRRGMRERAESVQERFVEMEGVLGRVLEEVFGDETARSLFLYGTEGEVGLSGEGKEEKVEKKIPVIRAFERLSLL